MADTATFGLTLVESAQAQKHITVNEAFARIDALAGRRIESFGLTVAPGGAADGAAYAIGVGASGEWAGQDGLLAVRVNTGWDFVTPYAGFAVWDAGASTQRFFDGSTWVEGGVTAGPRGAATAQRVVEIDHTVVAGATSTTSAVIPDKAVVIGVTARVDSAITGATTWQLGVSGSPDRYGSGLGTAQGSFAQGVSGSPTAYFGATALVLTAQGGNFSGGQVRLGVHFLEVIPPRAL